MSRKSEKNPPAISVYIRAAYEHQLKYYPFLTYKHFLNQFQTEVKNEKINLHVDSSKKAT